ELEDNPEYVNESPYEQAWMVVVELSDAAQLDDLMDADKYDEMTQE
ncbi:MAG TPA: glycine cleavage system protein H, partial [Metalysinibacillus sp.]